MTLQRLIYYLFGNNVVVGSHIKKQLDYLRRIVPDDFKHRDTHDLGCGDGKITVILKEIFQPSQFKGYDICPELVKRTQDKGIEAEVRDLGKGLPGGEMGIMWGVLHHLDDMEGGLRNVKEKYDYVFIREPLKTGHIDFLELGHPVYENELKDMVSRELPGSRIFTFHNAMFIFYQNRHK
jgi:SAM-dependent methyltransferase